MSSAAEAQSGPPPRKLKAEVRKLEGMRRELYSLMGGNTPPVLTSAQKFMSKPDWRQKVTPWTRVPFKNQKARNGDDLELYHWVRGTISQEESESTPYRFAEYNTALPIPDWEDKDYEIFKRDDWSIEETQYLFDLCKHYSLRWLVIHDRYDEDPKGQTTSRSVEDLKERYYEVCSALIRARAESHLSPADEELLEQMNYNKGSEESRKAHLERLQSRSPTEVAEEEALVLEAKRLKSMSEKMLVERQQLLRLLESPVSDGSIAQYQTSQGIAQLQQELLNSPSVKISNPSGPSPVRKSLTSTESGQSGSNANSNTKGSSDSHGTNGSASGSGSGAAKTAQMIHRKFSAKEEASYGISYHERQSAGVYLRSVKLPTLKQSLQARAVTVLNELGLPPRPAMPTSKVCAKFEQLQYQISLLLEGKRVQDKLQAEIDVLKQTKKSS